MECLERVTNVAQDLGETVKLTFDISSENEHNAARLYSWARGEDERLRDRLNSEISFVQWRDSPRVQAADLLAYEAWKALDHTVGPIKRKRKSWELLRATQRFETYSFSEDWFRDFKAKYGELEKIVGFNESDYFDWLKQTGRQHNITNLFHFLEWIGKAKRK